VQDDAHFSERFIPVQVGSLCNRLAYEARVDPEWQAGFRELAALLRQLVTPPPPLLPPAAPWILDPGTLSGI
jgi:hypothetical protein